MAQLLIPIRHVPNHDQNTSHEFYASDFNDHINEKDIIDYRTHGHDLSSSPCVHFEVDCCSDFRFPYLITDYNIAYKARIYAGKMMEYIWLMIYLAIHIVY